MMANSNDTIILINNDVDVENGKNLFADTNSKFIADISSETNIRLRRTLLDQISSVTSSSFRRFYNKQGKKILPESIHDIKHGKILFKEILFKEILFKELMKKKNYIKIGTLIFIAFSIFIFISLFLFAIKGFYIESKIEIE
jgi:hypothetical protein